MKIEYFDIHSHLYFPDYDHDREDEIEKIRKAKVAVINIGTDIKTSKQCVELAKKHKHLFACIGQHPGDLDENSVFDEHLVKLAGEDKVVAIGECGLDYYRLPKDPALVAQIKSIQKTIFEYHVDLAISINKPLMLHIRSSKGTVDAYLDALAILEHHAKTSDTLRGNTHFFAGDMDILNRLLAIGFTVSFTGVVTFTTDYDELIKAVPKDMIMVETDAPFVAPTPHRGKRNSPAYIPQIVEKIAEIRGESPENMKKTLFDNALKHFPGVAESLASFDLL